MDSATVTDTDVHNMARWGILFQDATEEFTGEFSLVYDGVKANVWNYIDTFGLTNTDGGRPLQRYGGGDTPVFWSLWNEYTIRPSNPYMPIPEPVGERLADWEYDLLVGVTPIGAKLAACCSNEFWTDFWNLIHGD